MEKGILQRYGKQKNELKIMLRKKHNDYCKIKNRYEYLTNLKYLPLPLCVLLNYNFEDVNINKYLEIFLGENCGM